WPGSRGAPGIYLPSALKQIVAVGETIDGKVISDLRLGRFGLDGTTLTFAATFADGSQGVFVAYIGIYPFAGFVAPVDNLPIFNLVQAGKGVPVKFSLGGSRGLAIFAASYPKSSPIACDSTATVDGVEQTVTAGASSLSYDPGTDLYSYVWKTDKVWANTCRQLVLKLKDNTSHQADFTFK